MFTTMRTGVPRMNACLDPDVWFIFNLHRELFFLSCTDVKNKAGAYLLKENILLERRPLAHGGEVPILSDPLLGVNCPCAPCISITPSRTRFPPAEHLF